MKTAALHYLAGLLACCWNAGIKALYAFLGVAGVAAVKPEFVTALNPHQLVAVFVGAAFLEAIAWLNAHPLPDLEDRATSLAGAMQAARTPPAAAAPDPGAKGT
jgi:hypothetical protein